MPKLSGQLTVVAVGKIKQSHWRTAQAEYVKRLGRYTTFKLIAVKDSVGKGFPDEVAKEREGKLLLKAAASSHRRILLSPDGVQMDSYQLARFLREQVVKNGRLAFLIGGPLGFSDEVLEQSEDSLSLSALTFPHELARVMLLEQLYHK
jgi:23S rRNA (pseudouridine1915-N3)-methyltransferase